jgi:hypothetical protein
MARWISAPIPPSKSGENRRRDGDTQEGLRASAA